MLSPSQLPCASLLVFQLGCLLMRRLLVLLLACGVSQLAIAAGDPARGQALTTVCAACHGADGKAVAATYPNLAGQNPRYLLRQLKAIKSKKRDVPVMAGQLDAMTAQDLGDIAAFYASKVAAVSQAPDAAALLAQGERIYRGGVMDKQVAACTACHSPMGNGNPPAGFPLIRGQSVDYVVSQLTAYREGVRQTDDDYGQMMRMVASHLTDGEIKAVADRKSVV